MELSLDWRFKLDISIPSHRPSRKSSEGVSFLTKKVVLVQSVCTARFHPYLSRNAHYKPSGSHVLMLLDRKSTRLNSSHSGEARMPSSA